MDAIRGLLRFPLDRLERLLGTVFPAHWNPLFNLGALGFFFYWVITVSGIYIYIFFDTGIHEAYQSIEYMTNEQWYLAGVMRSLHRYASDALIICLLLHMAREFSLGRYRGARWFSWVTGIAAMMLIYMAGISGYWLVWDKLAQYVAIVSTEWLDWLPIFGEPVARNFLAPGSLDNRFFTLMIFLHIAVPLFALAVLWMHLQRVVKPVINPPRGLAAGTFLSMLALSLVLPAVSQGPADLARVPGNVGLDWFYLPLYPLLERLPGPLTWSAAMALLIILITIPVLPPMKRPAAAVVDLDNCNGCTRCDLDCPYEAIAMVERKDDSPFSMMPQVSASLCVGCGICAGSCPTSMPFRRRADLSPGIDLPDFTMAMLRDEVEAVAKRISGPGRLIVFSCQHGVRASDVKHGSCAAVSLRCIGQLPPSFIDYVLSRDLADGVLLAGCKENDCYNRFGLRWTEDRLAGQRDPHLRARVDRRRLKTVWCGAGGNAWLDAELAAFSQEMASLESLPSKAHAKAPRVKEDPAHG